VHCAVNLDTSANNRTASIDTGLDRARDRGEVVELYAHDPGVSMPTSRIAYVLAGARDRGLGFVTYADFAHASNASAGLALSFDDAFVDDWVALRPLLQYYQARVTFFVCRYRTLTDDQRAGLQLLAADGHDIEPHSVQHFRAPEYVENHGLEAYLHDELDPSIDALRDDGFEVNAFAYPYGARTSELDDAIAKRVPVIRSVAFSYTVVQDPCPR
jgi:peptidoglycan/xylan/chitin deacetylase (PgdA/CDA1 family)